MSQTDKTYLRPWITSCLLAAAVSVWTVAGCDAEKSPDPSEATAKAAETTSSAAEEEPSDGETSDEEASDDETSDEESSGNETSGDDKPTQEKPSAATKNEETSEADDLSGGLYPGMKFTELSSADRKTFVSIAKKELCPCPDAAESLHACLQQKETQCETATRAAMAINRGLSQGLSESDILDKLATFVDKATTNYEFNLETSPRKGPADAPVTVVEFADFQCPHCKRASQMMTKLHEELGDDVVIYFKHFPLTPGSMAEVAARAAAAARRQGKFWPMQELLFENQKTLSRDKIMGFARRIGLNFGKFKQDLNDPAVAQAVQSDRAEGMEADITGTPAIFIDGYRYTGTLGYNPIKSAVQSKLDKK